MFLVKFVMVKMLSTRNYCTLFLFCLFFAEFPVNTLKTCPSNCKCGILLGQVSIDCENKNLLEFPRNMNRSTQIIRLRENAITSIPDDFPTRWPNTTVLSLEKNRVTTLQDGIFRNMKNLQDVFISENQVKTIGKRLFAGSAKGGKIQFHLNDNLIEEVPKDVFQDSKSSFDVKWNNNLIKKLPPGTFKGGEGITFLRLDHNRLEKLETGMFEDLPKLFHLALGSNRISEIDSGAFRGLHRVEILTLSKNRISKLPLGTFQDLTVVTKIHLEENLFSEFPADAIDSLKFAKVKMKGNPIVCNCQLKQMLSDYPKLREKIVDLADIKCANKNMKVLDGISDLNCASTVRPSKLIPSVTSVTKMNNRKASNISDYTNTPRMTTNGKHQPTLVPNTKNDRNTDEDYDENPPLPLIIGVTTGALIIVVVIVLFIYLYRRPIAARATTTLSLTRKRKNKNSSVYIYHYPPKNDYTVDYNI